MPSMCMSRGVRGCVQVNSSLWLSKAAGLRAGNGTGVCGRKEKSLMGSTLRAEKMAQS